MSMFVPFCSLLIHATIDMIFVKHISHCSESFYTCNWLLQFKKQIMFRILTDCFTIAETAQVPGSKVQVKS